MFRDFAPKTGNFFKNISENFLKMDPCLRILGPKMGLMFRGFFLVKNRPIWAAHPRIAFLWEYPPHPPGYEFLCSSRTPRQTQMRVCHPTLFQKFRAFDLCLFAKWLPPPATDKICYWYRLLKQGYWSLHNEKDHFSHLTVNWLSSNHE